VSNHELCVNLKKIRETADALSAAIPLPARYPPIPIDYIAPNLHVTVARTPVRIKAHVDDINSVDGFVTVAPSDDNPRVLKASTRTIP
jgi:hypothetical protein